MPSANNFMKINDIKYSAPTKANQLGGLEFSVEIPILYKEGETKEVVDNENADIELSPNTQNLLVQLSESIIKDIVG